MTIERGRRRLLRLAGIGLAATAGCLSDGAADELDPPDGDETTGDSGTDGNGGADADETASDDDLALEDRVVGTVTTDGVEVPLVSVDDAVEWHRDDAVFVDARGEDQYRHVRIEGARWSPAVGTRENDPVDGLERDARVVTYCGCPHHLSSMRAADMIANGYETVYALDEGVVAWIDRGYPIAGTGVDEEMPSLRVVRGRADPDAAGEMVIAEHEPSGQLEAAPVDEDGAYELHVRFADLPSDASLTLEAPGYEVTAPLSELEDGVVARDGTVR